MERGYQAAFYTLNSKVRDPEIRRRKGLKIKWAIETYSKTELSKAICLDVGCSSGMMTRVFAQLFEQTFALDYDGIALQSIEPNNFSRVQYVQGDAMCLPFPDNSVNVVVCAQVYEHVPNDAYLFREIYRVLSPGGMVFFSGPNWLYPIELHYHLPFLHWLPKTLADHVLQFIGAGDHFYEQLRDYWELRKLTRSFEIEDISQAIVQHHILENKPILQRIVASIPKSIWRIFHPLIPNFNWILRKPQVNNAKSLH